MRLNFDISGTILQNLFKDLIVIHKLSAHAMDLHNSETNTCQDGNIVSSNHTTLAVLSTVCLYTVRASLFFFCFLLIKSIYNSTHLLDRRSLAVLAVRTEQARS